MNYCYWCDNPLSPGTDIDIDETMPQYPEYSVLTNITCSKCQTEYEILKKRDAFD